MRQLGLSVTLFFLASAGAFAQTATILGTVTDQSGAVVPGSTVTITNTGTSIQRVVETNASGNYLAAELPVGLYSVKAGASGFKTYERTGLKLDSNATVRVDVALEVGAITENVEVAATAVAVQSDSSDIHDTMGSKQVEDLAINGRHIAALAILTPGASSDLPDFNLPIGVGGSTNISFNGERPEHNVWMIDGGENYDRGCGGCVTMMPSVDAISEFTTMTSNASPDFGIGSGGTINLIIKSGTRDFHGTAYELFRNDAMDANNFFANASGSPKPELRSNIFGYNIGGPIWIPKVYNRDKNRSFFFVNQEWRKFVIGAQTTANAIPAAQRQGDFSALSTPVLVPNTNDAAQNAKFAALGLTPGQPFPGNKIPASLLDPNALLQLNSGAFPLPNLSGDRFSGSAGAPTNVPETILRVDHYFTSKLSIMGHFVHDGTDQHTNTTLWTGQSYPTLSTDFKNPSWSAVAKLTWTISPSLLNEASYNMNGNKIYLSPVGVFAQPSGWNVVPLFPSNALNRMPNIYLQGSYGINYDNGSWPWTNAAFDHQYRDDVSWNHGSHNFRFGASYMRYAKNQQIFGQTQGAYTFDGSFTGNAVADWLLGYAKSYNELDIQDKGYWRNNTVSFYGTDNWRVNKRLTLNLGLRYDFIPHVTELRNRMSNFYPNLYNPANAPIFNADGSLDPNGPGFTTVAGVPLSNIPFYINGVVQAGKQGTSRGMVDNDYASLGPRVGFAYDVTGHGKTVVRGGFGIFYERIQGNDVYNGGPNIPFSFSPNLNSVFFSNPSISVINGLEAGQPIFPASLTALAKSDYKLPTSMQWNFGVQHELTRGMVLSVQYVGNGDTHQRDQLELNPVPLSDPNRLAISKGKYNPNLDRPYRGYSNITYGQNASNVHYEALQVNYRVENQHGLTLQAAYTWSHNLGIAPGGGGDFNTLSNPFNRYYDYGPTGLDRRQVLSLNYIYELPIFRDNKGVAGSLLGGWQFSGITLIQTGNPQNVNLNYDNLGLGGNVTDRADAVSSVNYPKSVDAWFNTSAFAAPAPLAWGTAPEGAVTLPGRTNFNWSLFKAFRFPLPRRPEGGELEFHADAFNVFNHTQFHGVDTGYGDSNFGKVTSVYDPRVLQLGLKFHF
ncbi:MAG TPA: TonB-dependent receptor [Bryobacteraceae bacterium]|nr:TonB-dependent receptor [Bryobacteraceae bacterium]